LGGPSQQLPRGHEDVDLVDLLAHKGEIFPEDFLLIWRKLQSLVVRGIVPGGKEEGRRLMRLFIRFKRTPSHACKELQDWIEALRRSHQS
jgi:hypothetical protein